MNIPSIYLTRHIIDAQLADDGTLVLNLEDHLKLSLSDEASLCCESRWMTTDDDPKSLIGSKLISIFEKSEDTLTTDDDYDTHEAVFIEVQTDTGFITLVSHNRHNGYYSGFSIKLREG